MCGGCKYPTRLLVDKGIQDPEFLKLHSGNPLFLNSVLSFENGFSTGLGAIERRKGGYISREISRRNLLVEHI